MVRFILHTKQSKSSFSAVAMSKPSGIFILKLSELDHYAGEICVTYLNFKSLKRRLIKPPKPLPFPAPPAMLSASLSNVMNAKTRLFGKDWLVQGKAAWG